jgi:hypothetical protein
MTKKLHKWVIIIFAVGILFAIDEHGENQKLLQLKEASKIVDQKLKAAILENKQEIEFIRMTIPY